MNQENVYPVVPAPEGLLTFMIEVLKRSHGWANLNRYKKATRSHRSSSLLSGNFLTLSTNHQAPPLL